VYILYLANSFDQYFLIIKWFSTNTPSGSLLIWRKLFTDCLKFQGNSGDHQAGKTKGGCPGQRPDGFWRPLRTETRQSLWAICTSAPSSTVYKSASCFIAAETGFWTGKTALSKGPEEKKADKERLFLGLFEASKSALPVPGGWQFVGRLLS